jgi:MFS transporter, FHS family, glucose/mannose:H+ symporter
MITALLLKQFTPVSIIAGSGFAIILPVLLFLTIKFPAPKQVQRLPLKEGLALVRDSTLLTLSMILFFESSAEGLMNNWTPPFLQKAGGLGTDESLYALTILAASLTVARLVLGGILARFSPRRILVSSLAIAASGAMVLLMAPGFTGAWIGMVLLGIGFAAAFPVVLGIIGGLFPQLSGTAFGIALVIALTGNTIMNSAFGAVSRQWGTGILPWYLLLTLAGLGVFLALGFRSLDKRLHGPRG